MMTLANQTPSSRRMIRGRGRGALHNGRLGPADTRLTSTP